jgi:alkylated DNA repair protein (DNA oxidative demethylase)
MSVLSTNCGFFGWVSDRHGYRYTERDPATGQAWPPLPELLYRLAAGAAAEAGFPGFDPEACLLNLYGPEAKMGLHQDRDEADFSQPVVSISFGRSARFRWGGERRSDPSRVIVLNHGDILIFGGPARLMYHGVDRLDGPPDPFLGDRRLNLTFRRVTPAAP